MYVYLSNIKVINTNIYIPNLIFSSFAKRSAFVFSDDIVIFSDDIVIAAKLSNMRIVYCKIITSYMS